jgi:hypothetical protein
MAENCDATRSVLTATTIYEKPSFHPTRIYAKLLFMIAKITNKTEMIFKKE